MAASSANTMTKLDLMKNASISPDEYQAPSGVVQAQPFRLRRGHFVLFFIAALSLAFVAFITIARSIQIATVTPSLSDPTLAMPLAANVELGSWVQLPIGNRVLVLPGSHQVIASAEGFEDQDEMINVGSGRHQKFEIFLRPLPGSLKINLVPEVSATVSIDGVAIGTLPGLIEPIPAGAHELKVDAPLYRASILPIVIQGRQQIDSVDISLDPAWANFKVASNPVSASVLIDGETVGKTPLSLKLEEGSHRLSLEAPKFKTFSQDFTVIAQQDLDVGSLELEPADGVLQVNTSPEEAVVLLNGEYQGTSPMSLPISPNEAHALQVYKAGFRLSEQEINLAPAQVSKQEVSLVQDSVAVRFSIKPSDAELIVDGVSRGKGSKTLQLNTLPHQVSVRKAGYVSYQNSIIPTKSSSQLVSVALLTKEENFWANVPPSYTTRAGHEMKLFKTPGVVKMGSSRREVGRRSNEAEYTAILSKHFYVSKHEVSNKQFRKFRPSHNSGHYKRKSLDSNKHPVANVSWQQAALYCNWLTKQEGLTPFYQTKSGYVSDYTPSANGYRLLTEVEWAWLARNDRGKLLIYPWGQSEKPPSGKPIGNFADQQAVDWIAFTLGDYTDNYQASSPVGRFPANHRGLFDMGGNVAEWVNDWYSANSEYVSSPPQSLTDSLGPEEGEFHVIRGASWARGHLPQLRLAYRDFGAKGKHDVGFRIARYVGSPE